MTSRYVTSFTAAEMQILSAAVNAFDIDETEGHALHLKVQDGGREWMVENDSGQLLLWVDDPAAEATPGQVALSDRVRRFADAYEERLFELSVVDDSTAVVTAGGASAAIDLVPQHRDEVTPWPVHPEAEARVSMREFLMILWSARCMPTGIPDSSYPMPPMWMEIGEAGLGLHVDWTDFLPSRATYRLATSSHKGQATVALPHAVIENFLRTIPLVDEDGDEYTLGITVGSAMVGQRAQAVVRLAGPDWVLVVWQFDPLGSRWRAKIEELLDEAGIRTKERDADEWLVECSGTEVRVKLHAGHPDVARVSAPMLTHTLESIELLRELGQLNAASNGLRYWLHDGVVRVAADVRCTTLAARPAVVRDVAEASMTYAPMLAAFATT